MENLDHIKSLSELLEVAVNDMEKVKKDKRYKFDVRLWHKPLKMGKCAVCVAGSIMAGTLESKLTKSLYPNDFNERTEGLLNALNSLRVCSIPPVISALNSYFVVSYESLTQVYSQVNLSELEEGDLNTWKKLLELCKEAGL